jgi:hypothetical protein
MDSVFLHPLTHTHTHGQTHKLGRSNLVHLYPLSFLGLSLQDTVQVTSTFDYTLRILTPKPNMYMVSLIRHLLNHPVGDSSRRQVKDYLLPFISFYILHEKPLNTKEAGCDDTESEEDFQKRVGDAVREMETWDWPDSNPIGGAAGRNNYLCIAESVVRNCRSIDQLSNMTPLLFTYSY